MGDFGAQITGREFGRMRKSPVKLRIGTTKRIQGARVKRAGSLAARPTGSLCHRKSPVRPRRAKESLDAAPAADSEDQLIHRLRLIAMKAVVGSYLKRQSVDSGIRKNAKRTQFLGPFVRLTLYFSIPEW